MNCGQGDRFVVTEDEYRRRIMAEEQRAKRVLSECIAEMNKL